MSKYLGEQKIESLVGTPYEGFTARLWAMEFIGRYGQIDGAHHKLWVLDQVARILNGTPVLLCLATWDDGTKEYRFSTNEPPSQDYLDWVERERGAYNEEEEEYEYGYDEGIAP